MNADEEDASNTQMDGVTVGSDSDEENLQYHSSLDWQSLKSPYKSFLYGWGNTVNGELGLGGIEDHNIPSAREVTFHDSENIKYGK